MYRGTVLGFLCFSFVLSAADRSDYEPSSLTAAWSQSEINQGADYLPATLSKYAVEAVYTGEHRELTEDRRNLLRVWAAVVGEPKFANLFKYEIAVRSENKVYWLPIQNMLAEPFANEVETGSRMKLYIAYIGAVQEDRVFLLNEFEVLKQNIVAIPAALSHIG
jgi:hypothetical protein